MATYLVKMMDNAQWKLTVHCFTGTITICCCMLHSTIIGLILNESSFFNITSAIQGTSLQSVFFETRACAFPGRCWFSRPLFPRKKTDKKPVVSVHAAIVSWFQRGLLRSPNREYSCFSLFSDLVIHLFLNVPPKPRKNEKTYQFRRTTLSHCAIMVDSVW